MGWNYQGVIEGETGQANVILSGGESRREGPYVGQKLRCERESLVSSLGVLRPPQDDKLRPDGFGERFASR